MLKTRTLGLLAAISSLAWGSGCVEDGAPVTVTPSTELAPSTSAGWGEGMNPPLA